PSTDDSGGSSVAATHPAPPVPPPTPAVAPGDTEKPAVVPAAKPPLRTLYEPRGKIDFTQLRNRVDAPWLNVTEPPPDAPVLRVSRHRPADGPAPYASIPEAGAAAPPGRPTIIEIDDNGPLYQSTALLTD